MNQHTGSPVRADYRVGRIAMLALVTGATAFGFSGDTTASLIALAAGLGTAVAGFYLDHLLDLDRDRQGGGPNPLAQGTMRPIAAWLIVATGCLGAALPAVFLKPPALIPSALVIGLILLLHIRALATPVVRAAGLGMLQALYALLGAVWAAAPLSRAAWPAVFLFFAMTGGKVLGDIRDLPGDRVSGTPTIPLRHGLAFSRVFLLGNEAAAYTVGIVSFFFAPFGVTYLAAMIATATLGLSFNIAFCLHPSPERARLFNKLSLVVLGLLYVAAMVAEGIGRRA